MSKLRASLIIFYALPIVLVALGSIAAHWARADRSEQLKHRGIDERGIITCRYRENDRSQIRTVCFEFKDATGLSHKVEQEASVELYDGVHVGSRVVVTYDPRSVVEAQVNWLGQLRTTNYRLAAFASTFVTAVVSVFLLSLVGLVDFMIRYVAQGRGASISTRPYKVDPLI